MPNGNPTRKNRELRPATITMHWFCLVSLLKGTHNNKDIHHEAANFLMCRLMILHAPLGIRCYFSFLFLQIVMWGVGGHQFGSNCKQSIWWQIPSLPRNVTNRSTSKTNPWENRLGAIVIMKSMAGARLVSHIFFRTHGPRGPVSTVPGAHGQHAVDPGVFDCVWFRIIPCPQFILNTPILWSQYVPIMWKSPTKWFWGGCLILGGRDFCWCPKSGVEGKNKSLTWDFTSSPNPQVYSGWASEIRINSW